MLNKNSILISGYPDKLKQSLKKNFLKLTNILLLYYRNDRYAFHVLYSCIRESYIKYLSSTDIVMKRAKRDFISCYRI